MPAQGLEAMVPRTISRSDLNFCSDRERVQVKSKALVTLVTPDVALEVTLSE